MKPICAYCGKHPRVGHQCPQKQQAAIRAKRAKPEAPKGIGLGLIEGGKK